MSIDITSTGPQTPGLLRYRFVILLGMLTLLLIVAPALLSIRAVAPISHFVVMVALDAMLLSAAFAVCNRRSDAVIALSLMVPALLADAATLLFDSPALGVAEAVLGLLALGFVLVILLRHLFTSRRVTFDTIAASLCVFLLLGVWWAMVHSIVDLAIPESYRYAYAEIARVADPGRLAFDGERVIYALYFSFVTLTTLGYGDIVPVSGPARMLTVIQAVTGQVYLAVLVARLVGIHIAQSLKD